MTALKMTLRVALFFFLLQAGQYAGAQITWDWAKNYGDTNSQIINGLATDSKGNIICIGKREFVYPSGIDSPDVFIYKLSPTGKIIWRRFVKSQNSGNFWGISIDKNDNICLGGKLLAMNNDLLSGVVTKYDSSGSFKWKKIFDTTYGGGYGIESIAAGKSGNIYVTGSSGNINSYHKFFVSRLDANGHIKWTKFCAGLATEGRNLALDDHENIYITGAFNDSVRLASQWYKENETYVPFIVKYDSSGNELWGYVFHGDFSPGFGTVDPSGSYYYSNPISQMGLDTPKRRDFNLTGRAMVVLAKFNPGGTVSWVKRSSVKTPFHGASDNILLKDNKIYLTGSYILDIGFDTSHLASKDTFVEHRFLAEFDTSGKNLSLQKSGVVKPFHHPNRWYTAQLLTSDPGGNLIYGTSFSDSILILGQDTIVNKSDTALSDFVIARSNAPNTTGFSQPEIPLINVYPNPSGGKFSVTLPADQRVTFKNIEVYSAEGRKMDLLGAEISGNGFSFNVNTPGIYVLKLSAGDKYYYCKLVVTGD